MSVIIRPYTSADKESVFEIFKKVWPQDLETKQSWLWEWFHSSSYGAEIPLQKGIVAENEGTVVGYGGILPRTYTLFDKKYFGGFNFDILVDPQSRGVGTQLNRYLLQHTPVLMGATLERNERLWKKIIPKKIELKKLERKILPLKPSVFLANRGVPKFILGPIDYIWSRWFTKKKSSTGNFQLKSIQSFDSEVIHFIQNFGSQFPCFIERSQSFMDWRFVQCPFNYHIKVLTENGTLVGLSIYRMALINHRKSLLFVEAMAQGSNPINSYKILLEDALQFALQKDAFSFQTLATGCPHFESALNEFGFKSRIVEQTLLAHLHGTEPQSEAILNPNLWYISMAESDFEFAIFKQNKNTVVYDGE